MKTRRILAWILSIAMVVTMTPTLAFGSTDNHNGTYTLSGSVYTKVDSGSNLAANDKVMIAIVDKEGSNFKGYCVLKNTTSTNENSSKIEAETESLLGDSSGNLYNTYYTSDTGKLWTVGKSGDKFSFKSTANNMYLTGYREDKNEHYPIIYNQLLQNESANGIWSYSLNKLTTSLKYSANNRDYSLYYNSGVDMILANFYDTIYFYKQTSTTTLTVSNISKDYNDAVQLPTVSGEIKNGFDVKYSSDGGTTWKTENEAKADSSFPKAVCKDKAIKVGLFGGGTLIDSCTATVTINSIANGNVDFKNNPVYFNHNIDTIKFYDLLNVENSFSDFTMKVAPKTGEGSYGEPTVYPVVQAKNALISGFDVGEYKVTVDFTDTRYTDISKIINVIEPKAYFKSDAAKEIFKYSESMKASSWVTYEPSAPDSSLRLYQIVEDSPQEILPFDGEKDLCTLDKGKYKLVIDFTSDEYVDLTHDFTVIKSPVKFKSDVPGTVTKYSQEYKLSDIIDADEGFDAYSVKFSKKNDKGEYVDVKTYSSDETDDLTITDLENGDYQFDIVFTSETLKNCKPQKQITVDDMIFDSKNIEGDLTLSGKTDNGTNPITNKDVSKTSLNSFVLRIASTDLYENDSDYQRELKELEAKLESEETLSKIVSVDLFYSENGGEAKLVTDAKLSKPIKVKIPYANVVEGKSYEVYHWDNNNKDFDELSGKGVIYNKTGYVEVSTDSFSPYIIVDKEKYYEFSFKTNSDGICFLYGSSYVLENEDCQFTILLSNEYTDLKVYDGENLLVNPTANDGKYVFDTFTDVTKSHVITATAKKKVVLRYDLDGGTWDGNKTKVVCETNETVKNIPDKDPVRTGYKFEGWKSNLDGTVYQKNESVPTTEDITLKAQWKKILEYKVTYNAGAGSGDVPSEVKYEAGASVTTEGKTATMTAPDTDKEFAGWLRSDNGQILQKKDVFNMPAMNVVLTAQWRDAAKKYSVTYEANGGTLEPSKSAPADVNSYLQYERVKAQSNTWTAPSDEEFIGWKRSDNGEIIAENETFNMPGMDITLIAQWTDKKATYSITYEKNNGENNVAESDVKAGTIKSIIAEPVKTGMKFAGWKDARTGIVYQYGDSFVMPAENVVMNAVWADPEATYNVDYVTDGNGCPAAQNKNKINAIIAVSKTETTKNGFKFIGWLRSDNGQILQAGDSFNMPGMNITLTAQWKEVQTYKVTYKVGLGTGTPPTEDVYEVGASVKAEGKNAEMNAPADKEFAGWLRSDNGQILQKADEFNMPAMNVVLTAQWRYAEKKYSVTYEKNGGTLEPSASAPADETKYLQYEKVTAQSNTWTAPTDKKFAGWKRSDNGEIVAENEIFNMPGMDITLIAQWVDKEATYTITYNKNNGEAKSEVSDVYAGTVNETIAAPSNGEMIFAGWQDAKTGILYQAGASFIMPGENVAMNAIWTVPDAKYTVKYIKDNEQFGEIVTNNINDIVSIKADVPSKEGCEFIGWLRSDNSQIVNAGDCFNMPAMNIILTAQWKNVEKYKVTYYVDGNNTEGPEYLGGETVSINRDKSALHSSIVEDLTKQDHYFAGWQYEGNVYVDGAIITMPDHEITLEAVFIRNDVLYNLDFDLNNGDPNDKFTKREGIKFNENIKIDESLPTREGYIFAGWKRSDDKSIIEAGENFNMPAVDLTLTAQWSKSYSVVFEKGTDNPNEPDSPASQLNLKNGDYATIVVPTETSFTDNDVTYFFNGWKNKKSGAMWAFERDTVCPENAQNEVITLVAQWDTKKSYNIVFDANLKNSKIDYVTINGYDDTYNDSLQYNGNGTYKLAEKFIETDKIREKFMPVFERVDYLFGTDGSYFGEWYLNPSCTVAFDARKTLAENEVDDFVEADNTVYLYAKWTPKYNSKEDVIIDKESLDDNHKILLRTPYSCYIKAYDANVFFAKEGPVYRNFYLKNDTKLPDGLELNQFTGEISGIPTKEGTYNFTVQLANDELKAISEEADFTIIVVSKTSSGEGSVVTNSISAKAGDNGSISYEGKTEVNNGKSITYSITPDRGYSIEDVIVDGKSIGAVASYTFKNVKEAHTIEATFVKENKTYSITFKDVKSSDWFYNSVMNIVSEGLMKGVSEEEFVPNDKTTRGMIVTILYRMSGSPSVEKASTFSDVKDDCYYSDAVSWAAKNGIVSGYDSSTFAPNDNITREQLAVILHRYAGYMGYNTAATSDISGYSDYNNINAYALNALKWTNKIQLITGYEDGRLDPQGAATRAQVATILDRFCKKVEWKK